MKSNTTKILVFSYHIINKKYSSTNLCYKTSKFKSVEVSVLNHLFLIQITKPECWEFIISFEMKYIF